MAQGSLKAALWLAVTMLMFGRIQSVALDADCSSAACTDAINHVCVDVSGTPKCRVKGDGVKVTCTGDGECVPQSTCTVLGGTCSCAAGYAVVTSGATEGTCLVALDGDCTSSACADTINHVCVDVSGTLTCRVKADGLKTSCDDDNKCVPQSTCDGGAGTCSCDAGYAVVTSGATEGTCLALAALDGDCSLSACADTDNHVCVDVSGTPKCRVKADGAKVTCDDDNKCVPQSTCDNVGGTCSCAVGYTVVTSGATEGTCTAVIGMECSATSTCSSALTNSVCNMPTPCSKGQCACADTYSGTDCLTVSHGMTCTPGAGDKCDAGQEIECKAGTTNCACKVTTENYYATAGKCTGKKLFTQQCSVHTDCLTDNTGNGDCIDSKCDCTAGYVQSTSGVQSCHRPYVTEVGCGASGSITVCAVNPNTYITGSQHTPTCSENSLTAKCECGTGNRYIEVQIGETCEKYCLDSTTPTLAAGAECTQSNLCNSGLCLKCPGQAKAYCTDSPCNFGVKMTANGIMLALFIALSAYLF